MVWFLVGIEDTHVIRCTVKNMVSTVHKTYLILLCLFICEHCLYSVYVLHVINMYCLYML